MRVVSLVLPDPGDQAGLNQSNPFRPALSRPWRIPTGAAAARGTAPIFPSTAGRRFRRGRRCRCGGRGRGAAWRPSARSTPTSPRVLQEQERPYMMLRMNEAGGGEGSDYGSYKYEEELEHHLRLRHQEHPGGVDGAAVISRLRVRTSARIGRAL
ncbi:hypothetical protein VPH35_091068 [Triticum aestivum]